MNHDTEAVAESYGLLACGSSGSWSVDVDQSWDCSKWMLQLDGPQVYLHFPIRDPGVVREAMNYLRAGRSTTELCLGPSDDSIALLHWDREEDRRCFLKVSAKPHSTMHLTLSIEDTIMLADAFEQILDELPQLS